MAQTFRFFISSRAGDDSFPACLADTSGRHWSCSSARSELTCSVDDSHVRVSCRVEQHCPYAEERQPIQVTVHVSSKHFLVESYSRRFFLSDIGETFYFEVLSCAYFYWCFYSKTGHGQNQKSQRYDGGVELPELLERPFLLLPTCFPDYTAERNVHNLWGPLRSQQRHKGGRHSKCRPGQMTERRTQPRSLVFIILDFNSQFSWNLPAWGEAEDEGHLY